MTVTFGYYSLLGIAVGTMLPVFITLMLWVRDMLQLHRKMSASAAGNAFNQLRDQYRLQYKNSLYPFILMLPFEFTFTWMAVVSLFSIPGGILLDNGFSIGYCTAGAILGALTGCITYAMFFMKATEASQPKWYISTVAVVTYLWLAGVCGVAADTWLF